MTELEQIAAAILVELTRIANTLEKIEQEGVPDNSN